MKRKEFYHEFWYVSFYFWCVLKWKNYTFGKLFNIFLSYHLSVCSICNSKLSWNTVVNIFLLQNLFSPWPPIANFQSAKFAFTFVLENFTKIGNSYRMYLEILNFLNTKSLLTFHSLQNCAHVMSFVLYFIA